MGSGLGASLPQPGSPQAGVTAWLYLALLIPALNLPSRLSSLPALPLGLFQEQTPSLAQSPLMGRSGVYSGPSPFWPGGGSLLCGPIALVSSVTITAALNTVGLWDSQVQAGAALGQWRLPILVQPVLWQTNSELPLQCDAASPVKSLFLLDPGVPWTQALPEPGSSLGLGAPWSKMLPGLRWSLDPALMNEPGRWCCVTLQSPDVLSSCLWLPPALGLLVMKEA